MYNNLKAEMARQGITIEQVAKVLKKSYGTTYEKLNKPNRLKLHEAYLIKSTFFPNLAIEYLFEVTANASSQF